MKLLQKLKLAAWLGRKIEESVRRNNKLIKILIIILLILYVEIPIIIFFNMRFKVVLLDLYLSPLVVFKNMFSIKMLVSIVKFNFYLLCAFFVILLFIHTKRISAGETSDFSSLKNFLSGKGEKKINYSKKNGTYGTAEWMGMDQLESEEMKPYLTVSDAKHAEGLILGYYRGTKKVICIPPKSYYNRNVAVFGSSGSMKSRSFVIPNILNLMKAGESMFVTDPKGELVRATTSILKKYGYEVRVLNLVHPECSDQWNILKNVTDDVSAITFAKTIIENTKDNKKGGDEFWDKGQQNLLKALALYIAIEMKDQPTMNMTTLYGLLTQKKALENMTRLFAKLPPDHPATQPFNIFLESADNEKVRAGMISGLATNLQLFQSKKFRMLTEGDDIDLRKPGSKKCAYFVVLPDSHSSFDFMAGLFFSFAFQQLIFDADRRITGKLPIHVNFILDEFPNVAKIPDVTKKISTIRSREVSMTIIFQNIAQLQNRYPDGAWEEILSGCDNSIFLACNENTTAKYISDTLGSATVEDFSENKDKYTSFTLDARETKRYVKRNLMEPNEVRGLDPQHSLVMPKGKSPIKTQKMDYTKHPLAKELSDTSLEDMLKDWSKEFHEEWKKNMSIKVDDIEVTHKVETKNEEKSVSIITLLKNFIFDKLKLKSDVDNEEANEYIETSTESTETFYDNETENTEEESSGEDKVGYQSNIESDNDYAFDNELNENDDSISNIDESIEELPAVEEAAASEDDMQETVEEETHSAIDMLMKNKNIQYNTDTEEDIADTEIEYNDNNSNSNSKFSVNENSIEKLNKKELNIINDFFNQGK